MPADIISGSSIDRPLERKADVVVVGSGPGGAMSASLFAAAGARVVVVEEGDLFAPDQMPLDESAAYLELYQEAGGRATKDRAITILQGRSVGGGSTVNWMTSLRTPQSTLDYWERRCAVSGFDAATMSSAFDAIERRLSVHPATPADINANNAALLRGLRSLGWQHEFLPRNAHECTNLGRCGTGCPIPAKRTATLTYLADALDDGAALITRCRVERIVVDGGRATGVAGHTRGATSQRVRIDAPLIVLASGAVNTPALLLRSGLDEGTTGRRAWLHPVTAVLGEYEERIDPWRGSPQSVGSHHFADRGARMGFFLETPPIPPLLGSLALPVAGERHHDLMKRLPHSAAIISLSIDGFSDEEPGGRVEIDRSGHPSLDYSITPRLREALVAGMVAAAQIHLAAGAHIVRTLHNEPIEISSPGEIAAIEAAPCAPNTLFLASAHPMGGCAMGDDRARAVVDSRGLHHRVKGLAITDGSLFPTSLGVNPMLTIYAVANILSKRILASV